MHASARLRSGARVAATAGGWQTASGSACSIDVASEGELRVALLAPRMAAVDDERDHEEEDEQPGAGDHEDLAPLRIAALVWKLHVECLTHGFSNSTGMLAVEAIVGLNKSPMSGVTGE